MTPKVRKAISQRAQTSSRGLSVPHGGDPHLVTLGFQGASVGFEDITQGLQTRAWNEAEMCSLASDIPSWGRAPCALVCGVHHSLCRLPQIQLGL